MCNECGGDHNLSAWEASARQSPCASWRWSESRAMSPPAIATSPGHTHATIRAVRADESNRHLSPAAGCTRSSLLWGWRQLRVRAACRNTLGTQLLCCITLWVASRIRPGVCQPLTWSGNSFPACLARELRSPSCLATPPTAWPPFSLHYGLTCSLFRPP
jgi:hypothetical protein